MQFTFLQTILQANKLIHETEPMHTIDLYLCYTY